MKNMMYIYISFKISRVHTTTITITTQKNNIVEITFKTDSQSESRAQAFKATDDKTAKNNKKYAYNVRLDKQYNKQNIVVMYNHYSYHVVNAPESYANSPPEN